MNYAFKYAKDNGLYTEDQYPYTAQDGTCQKEQGAYKDTGYVDIKHSLTNTKYLKDGLQNGPVSVAVGADTNWQNYKGGILNKGGYQVNHGVLAVGYGSENGVDYWIVKNSWGADWGEKGYVRVSTQAGSDSRILSQPSYPTC